MLTALTKAQWRRVKIAVDIAKPVSDFENDKNLNLDNEGDRYKARDNIVAMIEPWVASRGLQQC